MHQTISQFLAMPLCNVSTAAVLFEALENELKSHGIPCPISDTASIMVGAHNSLLSRVQVKQRKVFSLGCLCHLHHCVLKLQLPVSIDELLIDIL